jgi:hypothetical protein
MSLTERSPRIRRPLAAALLTAAAVAVLVVPAGASSRTTWTHQTLPCSAGHKSATVTLKWVPATQGWLDLGVERVVQKGWYDNPCRNQWLLLWGCQPGSQSDCSAVDVAPHHKGRIDDGVSATLQDTPSCDDHGGTTFISYVPAKRAPSCPAN